MRFENTLVIEGKNEMLWFGLHKTILFKICHKTISKKMWFIFCGLAKKKNINKGKLHLPYIGFDCLLLWKSHFLKLVPLLHVKTILEQFAKTKK